MTALDPADTIAAIASPPGPAVRGIVRLSGPSAVAIAQARFVPDDPGPWTGRAEHRAGRIAVSGLRSPVPARLIAWPVSSYTGEPSAEIHTTGAPPVLEAILADCLAGGARLAEPGEFTLRAFLSGRIDLTRAEAVLGVIEARDPAQLGSALGQLAGGIASPIEALRDRLLDVLAHLEADLDFADEPDVDPIGRVALAEELRAASGELQMLAGRLAARDRPSARPRVVLVGPPNAGKSRLFNALVGDATALVSPEAGTTRDYLSGTCRCGELEIDLIDTAGVERPRDEIEARAGEVRDRQVEAADLVLLCTPIDSVAPASAPPASDRPSLRVVTKADLAFVTAAPEDKTRVPLVVPDQCVRAGPGQWSGTTSGTRGGRAEEAPRGGAAADGRIATSVATGQGIDDLRIAIAAALSAGPAESALAGTSARCRDSLIRAGESLHSASLALTLGGGDELVAIDLRQALDDLGRVVGAIVTDDVLDRVFRRFCIGK